MPLESVAVSPEVSSRFHQPSGGLALRSPGKAATIGADTPYRCVPPTLPLTVTVPDRLCATDNGAAPVAVSACTGCAPTIRNAAQRRAAALHAPTAGVPVDDGRPESLNGAILPPFEDAPPPATGNLCRSSQAAPSPRHGVSGGLSMPERILSGDIEHALGRRRAGCRLQRMPRWGGGMRNFLRYGDPLIAISGRPGDIRQRTARPCEAYDDAAMVQPLVAERRFAPLRGRFGRRLLKSLAPVWYQIRILRRRRCAGKGKAPDVSGAFQWAAKDSNLRPAD